MPSAIAVLRGSGRAQRLKIVAGTIALLTSVFWLLSYSVRWLVYASAAIQVIYGLTVYGNKSGSA
jgi:hypothetical protein